MANSTVPITPPNPEISSVMMFTGISIPGRKFAIVSKIQPAIKCTAIFRAVLLMSHINLNATPAIAISIIKNIMSIIIGI